jgi:hypothetical protein
MRKFTVEIGINVSLSGGAHRWYYFIKFAMALENLYTKNYILCEHEILSFEHVICEYIPSQKNL